MMKDKLGKVRARTCTTPFIVAKVVRLGAECVTL